ALKQIESFRKGFPFSMLLRPCTVGDGITLLDDGDLESLGRVYSKAASSGRAIKFVPASGAASRMFKLLITFKGRFERIDVSEIDAETEKGDPGHRAFLRFIREIKRFAFYEDLRSAMSRDGIDIEKLISNGEYKSIIEYTLSSNGLNFANLPKGLIAFHRYPDYSRTPFEEHMVEAGTYTRSGKGVARVHFTVSPEHEDAIKNHIKEVRGRYEKSGTKYEFSFSNQKPSTDTIAVDMDNNPFRDQDGRLIFRPGGHGALLENLNDLKGDILFIKNIDNVVPDRIKPITYTYKKALGGFLIELQDRIFGYVRGLSKGDQDESLIEEVFDFIREVLSVTPPTGIIKETRVKKTAYLISRLNRPLRVCGMVKNLAEPGGGPFWVEHADKASSIQIVETSQIDMALEGQKDIFESSTHFNPVDLVCGIRDHSGKPFNLNGYVDIKTGFISNKSKEGRELKALELPGLWNGSMAFWNSVFVEVPLITFNPVKTVLDLLRDEHQPE
ncbi:DUF4301 family protein, partial [Thermodesulfobacteriota bacterium]